MPTTRTVRPEVMDSVALLVLDAQDTLIDLLYNKETFLKRVAFSIEAARCLGLKIIFTEQSPEKLGRSNKDLLQLAGNPRVFPKQSFSALGAPGIDRYLRDNEIYHLLVVGLETPICIYQTGLQALEVDVEAAFLVDALGCRRQEDEAPTLEALRRLGCQVLPSETLFYSLLAEASSPYFRDFTNLVKAFGQPGFSLEQYARRRPDQPAAREPRQPAERESREPRQRDERRPGPRDGRGPRPGLPGDVTHGDERAPSLPAAQAPADRAPSRGGRPDERRPRPSDERRAEPELEDEVDEEVEDDAEDGETDDRESRSESESAQGNGGDPARKRGRRRRRGGRGRRSGEGQPQTGQSADAPPSGQSETPSRKEPERPPQREPDRQPQREPARHAPRPEPASDTDDETEIVWPQPRKADPSQPRPERRETEARQPERRDAERPQPRARPERPPARDAADAPRQPARGAPEPTRNFGAPTGDKPASATAASPSPSTSAAPAAETTAKKAASPKKAARKATKKAAKKTARKAARPPEPKGE